MKVIKRDGREVEFNESKIFEALKKAFIKIDGEFSQEGELKSKQISEQIKGLDKILNVEEIQDLVEEKLMTSKRKDVAREYVRFRYKREISRDMNTTDQTIMELIDGTNEYWNTENSNKNPKLNTTLRDYMAGIVSKDMSEKFLLPEDIRNAHKDGILHFHDEDYYIQKMYNCSLINLEDMLQNGTVISGTLIEKPHSFSTACNVATQIIAQVASSQYGGQTISLSHLAPFVDVSRKSIRKNVIEERILNDDDLDENKIDKIVQKRLHQEIRKGIQTIQYQIVTLLTTNGQSPFLSLFMYLGEVEDKNTKDDLALLIEETLNQRIIGVKNEDGVWISPPFPKLLYVLEEDNIKPDREYWNLTVLSAKCSAKRLVPDYISEKKMLEYKIDSNGNGNCYPCMGK